MKPKFNYNERMNEIRREHEEMKITALGYVKEVFMCGGEWNGVDIIMPDRTIIENERDWIEYRKRTELEAEKYESYINAFCGR